MFYTDHSGPSNPLLDQLPSYQSLLYRRKPTNGSSKRRTSSRTRMGSAGSGRWGGTTVAHHEEKTKVLERPVRELPRTMSEKRRDR